MVFEIRNYQSQWLDIAQFNVPFPHQGAFVGIQILEVESNEEVNSVKIPLLFERKGTRIRDYIFTPRGWTESSYHQMQLPKEIIGSEKIRKQTFGFAAQVSFS